MLPRVKMAGYNELGAMSLPTVTVSTSIEEHEIHSIILNYLSENNPRFSGTPVKVEFKESLPIPPEEIRDTHYETALPKRYDVTVVYRSEK